AWTATVTRCWCGWTRSVPPATPGHGPASRPGVTSRRWSGWTMPDIAWGATWPSAEEFRVHAERNRRVVPVVRRLLADDVTPVGLYRTLAQGRPGTFVLESAEVDGTWSRYSFVGVTSR